MLSGNIVSDEKKKEVGWIVIEPPDFSHIGYAIEMRKFNNV